MSDQGWIDQAQIDELRRIAENRSRRAAARDTEFGWVVQASKRRSPVSIQFISDNPPVGLSDLQGAKFLKVLDEARNLGYWQLGTPKLARRINGRIEVTEALDPV